MGPPEPGHPGAVPRGAAVVGKAAPELGHSQLRLLEDRVSASRGGTEETFVQLLRGEAH